MPAPTIDRPCHWLRRNRASKRPEHLIFVDAEAHTGNLDAKRAVQTFRLGWAVYCSYSPETGLVAREWYEISDPVSFWLWAIGLSLDKKHLYIVAHNIGYDARILKAFSILPANGYQPEYAIMSSSCTFLTFNSDTSDIHLLDNSNYWQLALDDLGKEFGIRKHTIDFQLASDAQLSRYCKRDVQILVRVWRFWLSFLDENDAGDWAISAAGQAWNWYRHKFLGHKIGIHNRVDALALERSAYKGGRTETFKLGTFYGQQMYKLDVNGLYAWAMREHAYPEKLVKVLVHRSPAELSQLLDTYLAIADCIIETETPIYPYQLNDRNVYPTGTFRCTLTTPELKAALSRNEIRAIGQIAIYVPGSIFAKFIDHLTPLRQKYKAAGARGKSLICKLLRNSLQGKFGQRGYKQEVIGEAPLNKVSVTRWVNSETGERCEDWTFGGRVIRQYYTGEGYDSFPAIPAHVCAYGRQRMWNLVQLAGLENCWYMDTDSLIVNQAGFDNLSAEIDPLELGKLKVEGMTTSLEIQAKKSYRFGLQRILKGIKKRAVETARNTFQQWHFTTLNWSFTHGQLDDVLTYQVEKRIARAKVPGIVQSDGTVTPPTLSLSQEQAWDIVKPERARWYTWWVDVNWLASLPGPAVRFPPWIWSCPDWLNHEAA